MEVLKKEPQTYAAAKDAARLIYSIQQAMSRDGRKEEEFSRIVHQTTSVNSSPNTKTSLADDKALLTIMEQNKAVLGDLSASIGQMKKAQGPTVTLPPETNAAVFFPRHRLLDGVTELTEQRLWRQYKFVVPSSKLPLDI